MEQRRYALVAYSKDSHEEIIIGMYNEEKDEYDSKMKSNLATIDAFTMQYDNEAELLYSLFENGIISGDADIYIKYKNNTEEKRIPLLYSNDIKMEPFAKQKSLKVNPNTDEFKTQMRKLLNAYVSGNNNEYVKYMRNHKYINEYILGKLDAYKDIYIAKNGDYSLIVNKIYTSFTSYKSIRDLYIGTTNYLKAKHGIKEVKASLEDFKPEQKNVMLTDHEKDILDLVLAGEEIDSLYDREDLSDNLIEKIEEYHRKGI